jgi:hypothetical protein
MPAATDDPMADPSNFVSIGLQGGSGHSTCDHFNFNGANFGAFMASYFVGNLGVVLTSIFRVDAGIILGFTVILRLFSTLMGPCLGCFHDGEVIQPCLEKSGCPKATCGRRAPHLLYSVPICFVCTLVSYRMPSMATMTTVPQPNAKLTKQHPTISWTNATYQTWNTNTEEWHPKQWFGSPEQYTDPVQGMPCGAPLLLTLENGNAFYFNDTTRTSQEYGQDICTHLMGATSVCWPGPTGAPNAGDNNPRVCATMNSNSLITWFFVFALINRLGFESMFMLSNATSWEIYPWVQERQKNFITTAAVSILSLILFAVVLASPISNRHEFGSQPTGATELRQTYAFVAALFVLPSFLSICPWRDAKQSTSTTPVKRKPSCNQCHEWWGILTNPSSSAMRWMLLNRFFYNIRNAMTVSSITYYLTYVRNVPTDTLGTGLAVVTLLGLLSGLLGTVLWGVVLGSHTQDKTKTFDPKWHMVAFTIASDVVWCLLLGTWAGPVERNVDGTAWPYAVSMSLTIFVSSIYGNWNTAANGWAIDEDCQLMAAATGKASKRREAQFAGLALLVRGLGSMVGILIIGTQMGLPGMAGVCNTELSGKDNTMDCARGLWYLWMIGAPVLNLFVALTAMMYPIYGERLKQVIAKQGEIHKVIPGTKAFKGVARGATVGATESQMVKVAADAVVLIGVAKKEEGKGSTVEEEGRWTIGTECVTSMGDGIVLEVRQEENDTGKNYTWYKIELIKWKLAYDCKVIVYVVTDHNDEKITCSR